MIDQPPPPDLISSLRDENLRLQRIIEHQRIELCKAQLSSRENADSEDRLNARLAICKKQIDFLNQVIKDILDDHSEIVDLDQARAARHNNLTQKLAWYRSHHRLSVSIARDSAALSRRLMAILSRLKLKPHGGQAYR